MIRRAALVASIAAGVACSATPEPPATARTPRHLIIVTIDTLRADRLGAYGSTTVPTPHFDRIAREGVRALDATSHVPITRPSHATLFTARYPAEHGVRDNISLPLAKDVPTLAEALHAQGFATAAFVSTFVLSSPSGLDRGFDHYDDAFEVPQSDEEAVFLSTVQRRGDETLAKVEQWLDTRSAETKAKRTALWVHLYDPHDPYEPPEPFATQYADRLYDGEVAWTDTLLGRLRASLEARQLWDDALVVVTADHGEALGEHDETGHGFFAYETTLKIPFALRGPGVPASRTLDGTVRLVDVTPTVLELLGLPALSGTHTGTSIASHLADGASPLARTTYAESLTPLVHYQWSDLRVLRDGSWKYILAPRPELYDLATDPGETKDLSTANTATARKLRAALEGLLRAERERAVDPAASVSALSAEALQKLGALGYVSPGAAKGTVAQGADPKDKIQEFRTLNGLMRDGLSLLRERRFADSERRFASLQAAGSDSFQVHFYRGEALAGLRRWRDAEAQYERAIAAMPTFTQAHVSLANARVARQDLRGALAAVQQGQEDAPNEPILFDREGQIWQQLGDTAKAMAAYRRVADLAPKDALVRWRMGELLLDQGAPDQALAQFRDATRLDPEVADYWNSLGMVLGGAGQHDPAAAAFREAVQRAPKNARYAYNLGLVLQRAGRPEAREWFERTLAIEPGFRPARDRLAEMGR
ncbi:MAG: sulfatase-like hydrolase/transferase [Vicinamibacterales bacterium]